MTAAVVVPDPTTVSFTADVDEAEIWGSASGSPSTATFVPPTNTPVPPTATPEPTPGGIACELILIQAMFSPGDTFLLECRRVNSGPLLTVENYILLEVTESFWFWPGWTTDLDFRLLDLPPASDATDSILEFVWPTGAGSFGGVRFWGAFLAPSSTDIVGDFSMVQFGLRE